MSGMGQTPQHCGNVYAVETIFMNDARTMNTTGRSTMRRTLLTLLGAVAAFGVLTASYATAELPTDGVSTEISSPVAN